MAGIFISYNRKDRDLVKPIVEAFLQEGFAVYFDQDIPIGANWIRWMEDSISEASCFIYFASYYGEGEWQKDERDFALGKRKEIIPVFLPDVDPSFFGFLSMKQGVFWSVSPWDQHAYDQLRDYLNNETVRGEVGAVARLPETEQVEIHTLIGREKETCQILSVLRQVEAEKRGTIAFITGQSGYGINVFLDHLQEAVARDGYRVFHSAFFEERNRKQFIDDPRWNSPYHNHSAFFEQQSNLWRRRDLLVLQVLLSQCFDLLPADESKTTYLPSSDWKLEHSFRMMVDQGKPLVILLDDLENASVMWLDLFQKQLLPELLNGLPILFVISLHTEKPLAELEPRELPAALRWAGEMAAQGNAFELFFSRVTLEDVRQFVQPAKTAVVQKLFDLTDGVPWLIEHLWQEWVHRGEVEQDETGRYAFRTGARWASCGTARDYVGSMLDDLPYDDEDFRALGETIEERKQTLAVMLTYAANEGITFTPLALANTFGVDAASFVAVLEYLIDEDEDPGLIEFVEPDRIEVNRQLVSEIERCRFSPTLVWHALLHYPYCDVQTETLTALGKELRGLYLLDIQRKIDSLIRLARKSGDQQLLAQYYAIRYDQGHDGYEPLLAQLDLLLDFTRHDAGETDAFEADEREDWWKQEEDSPPQAAVLDFNQLAPVPLGGDQINILAATHSAIFGLVKELNNTSFFDRYPNESCKLIQSILDVISPIVLNNTIVGYLHYQLGSLLMVIGEYDEASYELDISQDLFSAEGNEEYLATVYYWQGTLALLRGDYEEALENLGRSYKISLKFGKEERVAIVLCALGEISLEKGDYKESYNKFREALEIGRNLRNEILVGRTLYDLGRVAQSVNKFEDAQKKFNESVILFQKYQREDGFAASIFRLGEIEVRLGHYPAGETYLKQALEIYQKLGFQDGIALTLASLSDLACQRDRLDEAKKMINYAMDIRQKLGSQSGIARCLEIKSRIAQKAGDNQTAREYLYTALEAHQKLGHQHDIAIILYRLGQLSKTTGDEQEAWEHFLHALEIYHPLALQPEISDTLSRMGELIRESDEPAETGHRIEQVYAINRDLGHLLEAALNPPGLREMDDGD
ncbi:MAG: tetratricopeptide repeat protein [Anaerolineaceae bacterium]|nr:tetratricopeptide repeat protein [Anaerolineaceae bacterium]